MINIPRSPEIKEAPQPEDLITKCAPAKYLDGQFEPLNDPERCAKISHTLFKTPQFGKLEVLAANDGKLWFIAADVAKALGYKNTRDAISKHVDREDKGVANRDTNKGSRNLTTINESGLYSLIFSSKLDSARAFRRWVTDEVLPSIRKNGGYIQGQNELSKKELMAKALLVADSTVKQYEAKNAELELAIEELARQIGTGLTIPSFCMMLNGVNTQSVQSHLVKKGCLIRTKGGFRPAGTYRDNEFVCKAYEYKPGKFRYESHVTSIGAKFLYRLYRAGKLPMRKDWNGKYTQDLFRQTPDKQKATLISK
jgi:prophage antirepressor-like protein